MKNLKNVSTARLLNPLYKRSLHSSNTIPVKILKKYHGPIYIQSKNGVPFVTPKISQTSIKGDVLCLIKTNNEIFLPKINS